MGRGKRYTFQENSNEGEYYADRDTARIPVFPLTDELSRIHESLRQRRDGLEEVREIQRAGSRPDEA